MVGGEDFTVAKFYDRGTAYVRVNSGLRGWFEVNVVVTVVKIL